MCDTITLPLGSRPGAFLFVVNLYAPYLMSFATGLALALSSVLGGTSGAALNSLPQAQPLEQYVEIYFADEPIMIEIAQCESRMRQFDSKGSILKNPNSSAIGLMQIMSSVHSDTADKLGIDIYTIQGNLAYARHLYDEQGVAPWNASKSCWSKTEAYKNLQKDLKKDLALAKAK